MNIDKFIELAQIRAEVERVDTRPDGLMGDMPRHFHVTLRTDHGARERSMSIYFSQGSGHTEPPTTADVVETLVSDASMMESAPTFSDFCDELGYDSDSMTAHRVYVALVEQNYQLRELLGAWYGRALTIEL